MFNHSPGICPRLLRGATPLRTALTLGCSALALALVGCGGGSNDTTPQPPPASALAAPANFTVNNLSTFRWSPTPGATRYELYVDPDGAGPLAEAKADDYNQATGTGFRYDLGSTTVMVGDLSTPTPGASLAASLNAYYRLRACDASSCGAFTEAKTYDIVNAISHEFPSGRVPTKSVDGYGFYADPRLSNDGLTLTLGLPGPNADSAVYVFTRPSSAQPWQTQAVLRSGTAYFGYRVALSSDGSTLAIQASESTNGDGNPPINVVYLYQRSGSTWEQQAALQAPTAPSTCPQPCRAGGIGHLALSANGNLLATSQNFGPPAGAGSTSIAAVVTYTRNGTTWSQQALLETGGKSIELLALADDGKTLAVNQGAFYLGTASPQTTTPLALVFTQQSGGMWSQQARIPVGIISLVTVGASSRSTMELSGDGNTLAILAKNEPGRQPPELDIKPADLSCGATVGNRYMALYARSGSTWQRQAAISRADGPLWALASDGNALFYGNALFTRSNGAWACP